MADRMSAELQRQETQKQAAKDGLASLEQRLSAVMPDFQQAMPQGREAIQLVRDGMHCLRTTRGLAECSPLSILGGLMTCAQLGLRPGVANLGEAWLIPYKNKGEAHAQLVMGYRGMIKLAYQSQNVLEISGRTVREGEFFKSSYQPSKLIHEPADWDDEPGAIRGYYAATRLAGGGLVFDRWGEKAAEAHRQKIVTAPGFRGGPWKDWPEEMKIKQCMRHMWRWLPTSLETEQVSAVDGSVRMDPTPTVRAEYASQIIDGTIAEDDDNPMHGQGD